MMLSLRNFRVIAGCSLFLFVLWLVLQLPDLGYFRLDKESLYLPQDGMVLVELKEGKVAESYPLASGGIGWRALFNQWPLILLSMMAGYPLGVMCLWLYRLLVLEEPVPPEASAKEQELLNLTDEQSDMLWSQALDLEDLRDELRHAQQELADQKVAHGASQKTSGMYKRKTVDLTEKLRKANAKIKLLEAKPQ